MPSGTSVVTLAVAPKSETIKYKGTAITITYIMQGKHRGMWEWRFTLTQPQTFTGVAPKLESATKDAKNAIDKVYGTQRPATSPR